MYMNIMSLDAGESDDEYSKNDSNVGEFEGNFLNDNKDGYEISEVQFDEEIEQEGEN